MLDAIAPDEVFPFVVVMASLAIGFVIAIVAILVGAMKSRAREQTKREIAAYVAEGSIDKETALALLQANGDPGLACVVKAVRDVNDAVVAAA